MHEFKITSGLCIPKEYITEPFYHKVKEHLVRKVKHYQDSAYDFYMFYLEGEKILKVPRFFPIQEYVTCNVLDSVSSGLDISINHKIQLRDDLQKDIVNYMLTHDRGVIQAPPGSGKTVLSIYAVAERKKKTLILVHKNDLVTQWIGPGTPEKPQGFLTFADIKEDEICRLTSDNYHEALTKSIIVTTDQTFLSLIKRQPEDFLLALNKSNIGIFISDECHVTTGAPTFASCSIHVPAKVVFGLSATPHRQDQNTDIIQYHLGDIYIPKGSATVMNARVVVLLIDSGLKKSRMYIYWGGFFQRARYLNLLKKSTVFVEVCKSLLLKMISDDRKVLFVAERLKFLDMMYDWLSISDKSKFTQSAGTDVLEHQIVFATTGKIKEGTDVPSKDTLMLTSPVANIEQICGRVLRVNQGKKEPLVVDILDTAYEDISRTFFKRRDYYLKKEWSIKYIKVFSTGEKREIDETEALEIIKGG